MMTKQLWMFLWRKTEMTTTVKNLYDLQDRQIMMEKKLPPYGYALILIVAVLMAVLVVWSINTPRVYVSQVSGTVQAENKSYIMSPYSGAITELTVSEGSYVQEGDLIAHIKSTDLDLQQSQLEDQLAIYQTQLSQYQKLIRSIQDNTNYFSETDPADQPYYFQYQSYQSQVSQVTFDSSAYQSAGYTEAQIQALMDQSQSQLEELYYSALQSASQTVTSLQSNIDNIQSQLNALNTGANDYYIYAPTSGVVHMDVAYKEGMVLSAGSVLGTVSSVNSDYEIVAYASLSDRPLLHEGDPCTIAVTGLAQTAYGTLTGTVTSIDTDVTTNGEAAYYKVTVKPDSTYLVSKSGDKVDLSNGMSVTARIQYDEVTYFQYVLEALGVLVR